MNTTNLSDNLAKELTSLSNSLPSAIDPVSNLYQTLSDFYGFLLTTLLTDTNDSISQNQYDALFTTLTPSSDLVFAGLADYQLVFGRLGNDILYPFDQELNNSTQMPAHIDMFFGDVEVIKLFFLQDFFNILGGNPPSGGNDTFVLGDWNKSYYDNSGYQDFAFIFDFNRQQDVIQLHGSVENYQFVDIPLLGTAIFEKVPQNTSIFDGELVGIVFANYQLDPTSSSFRYVGDTPPAISQPNIKQFGTPGIEISTGISIDLESNIYVTGTTNGSLQGTNTGSYDNWIAKYDNDGKFLWNKQFGSSKYDLPFAIATDNLGNVYVSGGTQGNLASSLQSGSQDAWLAKYDSNGNQLWTRQLAVGIDFLSGMTDIIVDNVTDAIYVSGLTVHPDPRPDSDPQKVIDVQDDFWVAKYDSNGNQQWLTEVGAPTNSVALFDEAYGITLGKDGFLYTTGWTYGDFSGQGGFNFYDPFIAKFDPNNGNFEKIHQFGSPSYDFSWDIDVDSQGNLYTMGWTRGDLVGTNAGQEDVWLAKFRPDGTQEWIRQFGTSGADGIFLGGLKIDANDNIFITGYTNGNLGGINAGSFDAWVARYNTNGDRIWLQQVGSENVDYATDITADNFGNLFVTGFTEGSLGSTNNGAVDTWIAKLDANTGTLNNFNYQNTVFTPNDDVATLTEADDFGIALAGNDLVFAKAGNDSIYGDLGNDTIFGNNGFDLIHGNQGDDIIHGNQGNDSLWGGQNNDLIYGGKDDDLVFGDLGNDSIFGGDAFDIINGNQGDDIIHGDQGNDSLWGGQNNDLIYGGKDDDLVFGDLGDDTLIGGFGNDSLTGGAGSDRFNLASNFGLDTILDFQDNQDLITLNSNLNFNSLSIIQEQNNTLIKVANSGEILAILIGISATNITAADFFV